MTRAIAILSVVLVVLLAAASAAASPSPPPSSARPYDAGRYERRLERLGTLLVSSIVSRDQRSSPIDRPRDVHVSFGWEAIGNGPWKPLLSWEANCNQYFYRLRASAHRLRLGLGGSSLVGCFGPIGDEDAWLDRFFSADPSWHLRRNHLILKARGWRMTLVQPRTFGGTAPVGP